MKKLIMPVGVIAAILLLFVMFYGAAVVPWGIQPTERNTFSPEQQLEICDKLKFKLAPGETLSTIYLPGLLQASTSLTVTIRNIHSKEEFLQRVHLETPSSDQNGVTGDTLYYDDLLLDAGGSIKDYSCSLSFIEENNTISACIQVDGNIPQLSNIYDFLDEPWQPYLSNTFFVTLVIIEFVMVIFLIVQISMYLMRLSKEAKFIP